LGKCLCLLPLDKKEEVIDMYIDGVIVMGLLVVAFIIGMMVYIYRYAQKHIAMDEKVAAQHKRKIKGADHPSFG